MICVVQRVSSASVTVGEDVVGQIAAGMLVLAAVQHDDTEADVFWTASKLCGLRIFRNEDKYFDFDVKEAGGSVLLVSNFTVAASTRRGRRPSLDGAATPELGHRLFDQLIREVRAAGLTVATGQFGAEMKVQLVNDGPVTFLVDSREARHG